MNRENEYSFCIDVNKDEENLSFEDIINCWPPNRRFFNDLIGAMNNNNLVPFIGAGLTRNITNDDVGFPSWENLLIELAKKENIGKNEIDEIKGIISNDNKDEGYELAAQILENISGRTLFQNDLRELFSTVKLSNGKLKNSTLMILPKLHPQIILTTNYDSSIERVYYLSKYFNEEDSDATVRFKETEVIRVLTPCAKTREFVGLIKHRVAEDLSKPTLYKFHGDVQDKGDTHDLILSKKSYDEVYGTREEISSAHFIKDVVKNLNIFLFAKTILFLGCSLNQDRIMDIIATNNEVEHYAFVGCGKSNQTDFTIEDANRDALERSKKLNEMNIHAIFYPRYARNSVKTLLENLANTNTSINVSSMYPKKSEWMENYFNHLIDEEVKKHIILFGGIGRNLREKSDIIKSLEKLLNKNKNAKIYFCYDSDNAAMHRNNQVKAEIERKSTKEKIEEIKKIPDLFSIENRNERIIIVPIKYDLTGYAILVDDKLFWNIITEQRSSDSPIIDLDIKEGTNINFINYIKYASEQTRNIIREKIVEVEQKHNDLENDTLIELKNDLKGIMSIIEIMDSYLNKNSK